MTRSSIGTGARHPASSVQVEERLEARHVNWRLEPNFALIEIVDVEGQQVRLIENRAPIEMVKRFAEQMKAGAQFPAIVVNDRGELIDGNTRRHAALKAGRDTISAYICSGLSGLQARSLSVELNQCHGLSMTEAEVRRYIRSAVQEGQTLDTKACARMTGMKPAKLDRWKAQATFELRAARLGIPDSDIVQLSDSVQAALVKIRLTSTLKAVAALAIAARMPAVDVIKLVVRVNAASSEAAALAEVSAERDSRADAIRSNATGFSSPRRAGQRSVMHAAALLKLNVDDLLDVPEDKRADAMHRLSGLRDHLDQAIAAASIRWAVEPEASDHSLSPTVPELTEVRG